MIRRVPFPNCRNGVIGLAIAGNPENDGYLSPWQEAVGHEITPDTHKNGCANEATPGLTLGLFIAAIVVWNSSHIADAIAHLRATEQSVPDAWLAHASPVSWEHVCFSGDFLWERAAATADKRRPLNLGQMRVAALTRDFLSPFGRSVV